MPTLQDLIDQGEEMRSENYDSPDIDMWQADLRGAVKPYGDSAMQTLENSFHFGYVITNDYDANQMSNEMISKVQKLLANLQKRNVQATKATADLLSESKKDEVREAVAKQLHVTINGGSVNLGDNGQISNIEVGNVFFAVQAEIEKLPDSEQKGGLLAHLKEITENPTFAAIAGASVSTLLSGFLASRGASQQQP